MSHDLRYLAARKDIMKMKSQIIGRCKKCKGKGVIPIKMNEKLGIVTEDCQCKKTFNKVKALLIAGAPVRRALSSNDKFIVKKTRNMITDKQINTNSLINKYLDKFDKMSKEGVGLLFFGEPGTGKTTCSMRIMTELIAKEIDCSYIYFKDMMSLMIDGYTNKNSARLLREILDSKFLIVDELSLVGRITPHMVAEFTTICKQRFENLKPSIIISNYVTIEDLAMNFGQQLESLIKEAFIPFIFIGDDIRERNMDRLRQYF